MPTQRRPLRDDTARMAAIASQERSILVEAGAGTGKTAVLAGRIAMLLARGIEPRSIAAVTFTEFASSELLIRIRSFVEQLMEGEVPTELGVVLPDGLSEKQKQRLQEASEHIDEITCTTIHGFCQRLISPYPVEADIDPGAAVMDPDDAKFAFEVVIEKWLREELDDGPDGLVAELAVRDPKGTIDTIHTILKHLRRHRRLAVDATADIPQLATAFHDAAGDFGAFMDDADEADTREMAEAFGDLAKVVRARLPVSTDSDRVVLLLTVPRAVLWKQNGGFRAYRKKGKWKLAARRAGRTAAEGEHLNERASALFVRCCETWSALQEAVAAQILADLMRLVEPALYRFREHKREVALLDFDDLIFAACDLLREHDDVRRALGKRFSHVLVDEFQDTDPLQTEIFWRLCGDPPSDGSSSDWTSFVLRPGALFLVGDPKQAIYRFRGADIAAYLRARETFEDFAADGVIPISTNFRSCPSIMHFVNNRFELILSRESGQPGFHALDPFQPERPDGPAVVALDVAVADEEGKATAQQIRDGEADAVAEFCARLIGSNPILVSGKHGRRPCKAGDIALLAPTGADLWRYEAALERRRIPVATQAGKGLYRRQEIQDLIAITRVLADPRDTLALGALLRGPLVGLTEEELLDIVCETPSTDQELDGLGRLSLNLAPEAISDSYARDILEKLKTLHRKVNSTTPHKLLSEAIDLLRVRPILLQRHRNNAERALANVDLYLSFSRRYAVKGLRAFAEAMTAAWTEESRAVEGRPDARGEAVSLYTMHAAKGLEWPVVVPINTMTKVMSPDKDITDRTSGFFYCPIFGVEPTGFQQAIDREKAELVREHVRLWYVATTRARELLVLPRFDVEAGSSTWNSLVDLSLAELPVLNLAGSSPDILIDDTGPENTQTRDSFASEAALIAKQQHRIAWRSPSRAESPTRPMLPEEIPVMIINDSEVTLSEDGTAELIQGGYERGLIVHKLIEEVLTGETGETKSDLIARATTLIETLEKPVVDDPAIGLSPTEIVECVVRGLSVPEIVELRPSLLPEFPVFSSAVVETHEEATAGIADAIAMDSSGQVQTVIEWKSDVDPSSETIDHYCDQLRTYLEITGAESGLIVMVTTGNLRTVQGMRAGSPKPGRQRASLPK